MRNLAITIALVIGLGTITFGSDREIRINNEEIIELMERKSELTQKRTQKNANKISNKIEIINFEISELQAENLELRK
jgi:uncharacterized protein HemX